MAGPQIRLIRHEETIVTRLRFGRTKLTYFHIMYVYKEPKPRHETCNYELVVKHINTNFYNVLLIRTPKQNQT